MPNIFRKRKSLIPKMPESPLAHIKPAASGVPAEPVPMGLATPPTTMPAPMIGGQPLMRLHSGGVVPEDGVYELKKGERVVKAEEDNWDGETRRCESPNTLSKRRGY